MLLYRRELDGLRALAVIVVIIYHANLLVGGIQLFPGGFLGVDVFFVLSGYLITNIIRNSLDDDTFTFRDFYWRRAKRIVPALLLVLIFTSIIAYAILLPNDLVEYSLSLESALYFASNHFFYNEDSYVAAASIYKPLLHTWSLAVEWQFYLVYPVVIWLVARQKVVGLRDALLVLAIASFVFAQWMVTINPDYAFYMLPTRAWELILGGLVTFVNREQVQRVFSNQAREWLLLASLIGLLTSLILFDHHMQHPSYLTLVPVICTCMFIALSGEDSKVSHLFCLKPAVFLGVISYSLYLWHQPLFVFFRFLKHDYMRPEQFLGLLVLAIVLAWLSMKFIEKPARRAGSGLFKFSILSSSLVMLGAFSLSAIATEGFPSRNGPVIAKLFHNINALQTFRIDHQKCHDRPFEEACYVEGEQDNHFVLVGDSHAGAIGKSVFELAQKEQASFYDLSTATCLGIDSIALNIEKQGVVEVDQKCLDKSEKIAQYLESEDTPRSTIFFVGRLPLYLSGEYFDNQEGGKETGNKLWLESLTSDSVEDAIANKLSLWSSKGHNLVMIYPVPEAGWVVPLKVKSELDKYSSNEEKLTALQGLDLTTSHELYKQRTTPAFSTLNNVQGEQILRIFPEDVLCRQGRCFTHSDSALFYYDDDHLSATGAEILLRHIEAKMNKLEI